MSGAHFSSPEAWRHVFNTPLECGLRCVALLLEAYPKRCDVQRLVQFEYLVVHSGDVEGAPPSLHPAGPHRAGELLVRRALVERGLMFMLSRRLVCRELSAQGIGYFAGDEALPLFESLSSDYARGLRDRARWVVSHFGDQSEGALAEFMRSNWTHWGAEFEREVFARGEEP